MCIEIILDTAIYFYVHLDAMNKFLFLFLFFSKRITRYVDKIRCL